MRKPRLGSVALLFGLAACGGHVNLGEKRGPEPGVDADLMQPEEPDAPVGKPVAQLTAETPVDLMVVDGDFLYVGNFHGLSRCQKLNCIPTLELLPGVGSNLGYLQVHGRSLGVSHSDLGETWLALYALPLGTEERVVLRQLPSSDGRGVLWHGGFVFWGLDRDWSIYRCALPSCEQGPEKVGTYVNLRTLQADGEVIVWNDDSFIYRSGNFGAGAVETLRPDELLSEAPVDPETHRRAPGSEAPLVLAVGDGLLYASLEGSSNCYEGCSHSLVRWPVKGGAREEILITHESVRRLFVFGSELVWVESRNSADFDEDAALWSCSVDDCAATRRKLGYVVAPIAVVVADDLNLYWLDSGSDVKGAWHGQIRRAPRLSPADE